MKTLFYQITSSVVALTLMCSCDKGESPSEVSQAQAAASVVDLGAEEAAKMVASGEIAVLDVRTTAEYDAVHIDGATLVDIQAEGFEEGVAKLDQSKPYLVHCAAGVDGGRSRRAVETLKKAGAKEVYHLDGGINAWIQGDHPVTKK